MTTREDVLETLSNQLRNVQAQAAELKDRESDLKARIRDLLGDEVGTIFAHGKPILEVSYPRRFNEDAAREVLSSDLLAACSVTTISSQLAKKVLAPAIYELCQRRGDNPVIRSKVAA